MARWKLGTACLGACRSRAGQQEAAAAAAAAAVAEAEAEAEAPRATAADAGPTTKTW
jgi:hypothetical protein